MRTIRIPRFMFVLIALAQVLLCAPGVHAQLSITWNTTDGGGGTSSNGSLSLSGTVGQPDASPAMTSGTLSLRGGFWAGAIPLNDCPADIVPTNTVDVNDLLAVITNWGSCPLPCPPRCAADIDPIGVGNCSVDVNDLLRVITSWGACP